MFGAKVKAAGWGLVSVGRPRSQPIRRVTLHSISPLSSVAKERVLPVASKAAGGAAGSSS